MKVYVVELTANDYDLYGGGTHKVFSKKKDADKFAKRYNTPTTSRLAEDVGNYNDYTAVVKEWEVE